ncbi:MAG: hypothetical protein MJY84_00625 [Bacteroidales bacterium]|nr:hypothetical protein [Bacteroidales bacterium]
MKKVNILLAAILVLLSSCTKETLQETRVGTGQPSPVTFTAKAEVSDNALTKTTLTGSDAEGYDVVWSSGDDFRLLYKYSRMYSYWGYLTYSISSTPGTTSADFSTTDSFKSEDFSKPVVSFYPASLIPDGIDGKTSSVPGPLSWPASQEYVAGTASRCPMASLNTDPAGTFTFKNLGGILRLSVKGSGRITSIRISADQKMSGSFLFNSDKDPVETVMLDQEEEDGGIVLDCSEGIQLSDSGVDFHFNVPAGTYSGFKVEFFDGDLLRGTRTAKKDIIIKRSCITAASMTAPSPAAGKLLGTGQARTVTKTELIELAISLAGETLGSAASYLNFLLLFDLKIVPVRYATTDVDGNLVSASGLIAYPDLSADEYGTYSLGRIVSIQHGTCDIDEAPSRQDLPMELLPTAAGIRSGTKLSELLFGEYFVACMADYLGYGATENSSLLHPYLHNRLTGSTCADLIAATEEYIEENGLEVSTNTVDLVGYSQGGAATISTMLELLDRDEEEWSERIGDVWAGAGPYDILAFMDSFAQSQSYSRSCYIPYAMRGLAYGESLDIDWDNVYNADVGGSGKGGNQLEAELFSKTQVSTWTEVIGTDVTRILNPDFYGDGNDDIRSLKEAALANSVTSCTAPSASMKSRIKLYHSPSDDTVPFVCSTKLQEAWGLDEVTELTPGDHVEAGVDFLLAFCGLDKLMDLF